MDYEKLGLFYLGKEFDLAKGKRLETPVLYDSRDLTTHAAIIGMTGSGKTGLGIGLLEEALIDNIPFIAIDPKGDLPNLLLTFPTLDAESFEPWVEADDSERSSVAKSEALKWKKGIEEWGQTESRIESLRENAELRVYTPGSSAARALSLLGSLEPPSEEILEEADLFAQSVESNTQALLTLAGLEADPIASREHALVATIISGAWSRSETLSLTELIASVQRPDFDRIGALDLESYYPAKDRFELAARLNQLLASPSLQSWTRGESLDVASLLHSESGRPRGSIMTIAHLDETERMFFVTTLLDRIISWMRRQPGTSSLRAILYIDEIFGLLPPVANPPSKKPLLTLLKQARAHGLGVVVATQNPVDLDYKALSNTGTWFLGRLQTERDRSRVMDGLRTLSSSFDHGKLDEMLSSMKKRVFLLHNVHEKEPVVFETRWVLSYLRGPLTRSQLSKLDQEAVADEPAGETESRSTAPPITPPGLEAFYEPASAARWSPALFVEAEVRYDSRRYDVSEEREVRLLLPLSRDDRRADWDDAEETELSTEDLEREPPQDAPHEPLPSFLADSKKRTSTEKAAARAIRQDYPLLLLRHPDTKTVSRPDESEGAFRARVAQKLREERDEKADVLRSRYAKKLHTLQARLERAEHTVEKQQEQARAKKFDTAVSFGTSILGAVLGRRRSGVSGLGTAVRRAGRIRDEEADVERALEKASTIEEAIEQLEAEMNEEIGELEGAIDPAALEIAEIPITAKVADVEVETFALLWRATD